LEVSRGRTGFLIILLLNACGIDAVPELLNVIPGWCSVLKNFLRVIGELCIRPERHPVARLAVVAVATGDLLVEEIGAKGHEAWLCRVSGGHRNTTRDRRHGVGQQTERKTKLSKAGHGYERSGTL
jgi:hypothetical protein